MSIAVACGQARHLDRVVGRYQFEAYPMRFMFCLLRRTMHEVWQTLLEETDRVGKARLLSADTYLLQISEPCKLVRGAKCQVAKKVRYAVHITGVASLLFQITRF